MADSTVAIFSRSTAAFGLDPANLLHQRRQLVVGVELLGLDVLRFRQRAAVLLAERLQLGFDARELLAQPSPIDLGDLGPQFLQAVGVLFVAAGFAGLGPHAAEPALDLVDNVGEPQQVLFHALEPAEGFHLPQLEPADAGRFLEDHPAVLRRGLQQHVNLALLDHAVGLAPMPVPESRSRMSRSRAGLRLIRYSPRRRDRRGG